MAEETNTDTGSEPGKNTDGSGTNGNAIPENAGQKLFTQADLDAQITTRLNREREANDKKQKQVTEDTEKKRLVEQNEYKTLAERLEKELGERTADIAHRDRSELKRKSAASVFKNPDDVAEFAPLLTGETEQEFVAHAERIAKRLTPPAPELTFNTSGGAGGGSGNVFDKIREDVTANESNRSTTQTIQDRMARR